MVIRLCWLERIGPYAKFLEMKPEEIKSMYDENSINESI